MTIHRSLIAGIGLYCAVAGSALAQDQINNIGVSALVAEKAPNTTVSGQTKPPSRDASPTSVKPIGRPTPRQAADDAITSKICTGCKPDPATTGALSDPAAQGQVADKLGTRLGELRTMAPPQQQSDLNTVQLASAHRERAKSVEEKTDGLWQSWLVSVCEGCGDQKPARALRYEEWPDRNVPVTTGSIEQNSATKANPVNDQPVSARSRGTLEADLSPANVDSIRRMPAR